MKVWQERDLKDGYVQCVPAHTLTSENARRQNPNKNSKCAIMS